MVKQQTKFYSLNIYRREYEKSIRFYEDCGFKVVEFEMSGKSRISKMKLHKDSDFMITIIEDTDDYVTMVVLEHFLKGLNLIQEIDMEKEVYDTIDTVFPNTF